MSRKSYSFLPDERVMKAPRYPDGRPPTRREVWEREHALWYDRKRHQRRAGCTGACNTSDQPGELEAYCKEGWIWFYLSVYNFKGWRKQPDWVEGDPVIPEAVPTEVFFVDKRGEWAEIVYRCLNTALGSTHNAGRRAA